MFSVSAVKGKFKRSKINFKNTFLFDNELSNLNEEFYKSFVKDEICIIYYIDSDKYSWFLTDRRFIIPNKQIISLSELKNVDFTELKETPSKKLENTKLTLYTDDEKIDFQVEKGTWHLIYNIFKFIVDKNNGK